MVRQRDRSDHDYPGIGHFPDLGQELTWQLSWQHTTMLIDDRRGNCSWDITEISRDQAGQTAAELAARWWPPDAARLPWVASVYPAEDRRPPLIAAPLRSAPTRRVSTRRVGQVRAGEVCVGVGRVGQPAFSSWNCGTRPGSAT